MYSEEQYCKAFEIYEETKSITQTIIILDIPGISKIPLNNTEKAVITDTLKKKYSLPVLVNIIHYT